MAHRAGYAVPLFVLMEYPSYVEGGKSTLKGAMPHWHLFFVFGSGSSGRKGWQARLKKTRALITSVTKTL
jgi:hypothetical protein